MSGQGFIPDEKTTKYCGVCGKEMAESEASCPSCGAWQDVQGAQFPASPIAYSTPQQQTNVKKKFPIAAVLIPIFAAVAVVALLVVYSIFFSGSQNNTTNDEQSTRRDRNSLIDDEEDERQDGIVDDEGEGQRNDIAGNDENGSDNIKNDEVKDGDDDKPETEDADDSSQEENSPDNTVQYITDAQARALVETWLAGHTFSISFRIDPGIGEFIFDNKEHYALTLSSMYFSSEVYVNKITGELLIYEFNAGGWSIVSLDQWYYNLYAARSLDNVILETNRWIRLSVYWGANSVTVFERDLNSPVWTMQSRDGNYRMVDMDFSYEGGIFSIGFPTTSNRYYFYSNNTGSFGGETMTWNFETDPFYSMMSVSEAFRTDDLYGALNRYMLLTIHVYWPNGQTSIFYKQSDGRWMMKDRSGNFSAVALNFSGNSAQVTMSSTSLPNAYVFNSGGVGSLGGESILWDYSYSTG